MSMILHFCLFLSTHRPPLHEKKIGVHLTELLLLKCKDGRLSFHVEVISDLQRSSMPCKCISFPLARGQIRQGVKIGCLTVRSPCCGGRNLTVHLTNCKERQQNIRSLCLYPCPSYKFHLILPGHGYTCPKIHPDRLRCF